MKYKKSVISLLGLVLIVGSAIAENELSLIPADSWVFIKFRNFSEFSERVDGYAKMIGEEAPDLLDTLIKKLGVGTTIDVSKPMVLVVMSNQLYGEQPVAFILNVKEYDNFAAALDAKAADIPGMMEGSSEQMGECYFVRRGNVVILSPNQGVVNAISASTSPITEVLTKDSKKLSKESDVYIYVNLQTLVPVIKPFLMMISAMGMMNQMGGMQADNQQGAQQPGGISPQQMQVMQQLGAMMNAFVLLLDELKDFDVAVNFGKENIRLRSSIRFKEGGEFAKIVGMQKLTEKPLIKGLPKGEFAFVGGGKWETSQMSKFQEALLQASVLPLQTSNPQLSQKYLSAAKEISTLMVGNAYKLVVGGGDTGKSLILLQMALQTKDSAKYLKLLKVQYEVQNEIAKILGQQSVKYIYKENTGVVNGCQLNTLVIDITEAINKATTNQSQPVPIQPAQLQEFLAKILGQGDKIVVKLVKVDDKNIAVQIGGDESQLKELVSVVKRGIYPINEDEKVVKIAKLLPAKRVAECYFDFWNLAHGIVKILTEFREMEKESLGVEGAEEKEDEDEDESKEQRVSELETELAGFVVITAPQALKVEGVFPVSIIKSLSRVGELFEGVVEKKLKSLESAPRGIE